MSGAEVLAVVACVAAIVSAYNDGSELVRRIKAKRQAKKRALAEKSTQGLEASLTLGPPAVQSQYDSDFRRFGAQYAQGDQIAREQMKDIIINLQMALLTNLRLASEDGIDVNFVALQIASDDSRVNAVMALCQLYQRMAAAAPVHVGPSPMSIPGTRVSQFTTQFSAASPDQRFSYASTAPSLSNYSTHMSTSPADDHIASSNVEAQRHATKQKRTTSISSSFASKRRSFLDSMRHSNSRSKDLTHSASRPQQSSIAPVSETCMGGDDAYLESVGHARDALLKLQIEQHGDRQHTAAGTITKTHYSHAAKGSMGSFLSPEEAFNPWTQDDSDDDDNGEVASNRSHVPSRQTQSRGHISQGYTLDDESPSSARGDATDPLSFYTSATAPPVRAPSSGISHRSTNSSLSGTMAISGGVSMSLYLPSEENGFSGFCKGAWKLQIGVKKAFKPESRPAGMYSDIPFWRCSKCCYEGPMAGGVTKTTRTYDNRVRIHYATGIRYRWVFLAKSHIAMRKIPVGTDGTIGIFGCIFCCAERRAPAPTFGNISVFMEHLLQHRYVAPGMDALLDRTRCIVGRVADMAEDFDINIPPDT